MDEAILVREDWLRPDGVRVQRVRCANRYDCSARSGNPNFACDGWHVTLHWGFWGSLRESWRVWLIVALSVALMVALILWGTPLGPDDWGEEGFGY